MGVFRMVRPEYEQVVATVEPLNPYMDPVETTLRFRYLTAMSARSSWRRWPRALRIVALPAFVWVE